MPERTLVVSATNLLARGFLMIPTDRKSRDGAPVNALFAVARAIHRVMAFKTPARAVAVIEEKPNVAGWPPILKDQLPMLPELFRTLGIEAVVAPDEIHVVASYAKNALDRGDDVILVAVDKRYAQLVSDRLWWYDANKDVRYTPEIVAKRFNVPPANVGEWLAMVGDDSGNDVLPGVKGIGAKGATQLIEENGSITNAMAKLDELEGRLAKALKAAKDDVPRELARGRLDGSRSLPIPLDKLPYRPPNPKSLNALYEKLAFAELLSADGGTIAVEVCEGKGELAGALAKLSSNGSAPIAIHALMEDPAPVRASIAGIALANGSGQSFWVPFGSGAWPELATWLADEQVPKIGHSLVGTIVELRRAGIDLEGIVGDSAVASHITESSNWAPHDLEIVAKHALGRALHEDDAVRGVGK